jgi:tRNA 2-thiouridine synthesizing protein A
MYTSQADLLNEETTNNEAIRVVEPDVVLELGAAKCPLLGLKSMKALRALEPGQIIEIVTSGRGAEKALRRVAWMSGNELLGMGQQGAQFKHWLKKV